MNTVLGDRLSCNTNLLNSCTVRYYGDFECVILQHILMIDTLGISSKIALKLVQQGLIDHKATLVFEIAWHHQGEPYLSRHTARLGHIELIKTNADPAISMKLVIYKSLCALC